MKQLSTPLLRFALALVLFAKLTPCSSQKQLEFVSHLDFVSLASDVWGYTAPDGTEYALICLRSGVSIVSLADPANPVELQLIPGDQSVWRDVQTWGTHAYVTCDQPDSDEGLLIIDLSNLPGDVTWTNWRPYLPGQLDSLKTCHTLWIDEAGYAYLNGCEQNGGGPIILDVHTTPGQPQFVGYTPPTYAHDCFAQGDRLYTAEIYQGTFSVLDISDRAEPVLLATQPTPFDFCHNIWSNANGTLAFTTDERGNASVACYDISDLSNIRLLDEFRPIATLNTGVIPHNAYAVGNHVVIAHYTDGVVIVDATRPDNLIEVESFDTNTDFTDGFHGCWATCPYLPSGLILASDIENGLYVFKPTYPVAAYLEGTMTNGQTGQPIPDGEVRILSPDANFAKTDFVGKYKTGQATADTFLVEFKARGYFDLLLQTVLEAGEVTILNAQMVPLPEKNISGVIKDSATLAPLADARVLLENEEFTYETITDTQGAFEIPAVLLGDYSIHVGKWGYHCLSQPQPMQTDQDVELFLRAGYDDDFNNDLGWIAAGTATNGQWERGIPIGIFAGGKQFTPAVDSPNDPGNRAFLTGNSGGSVFANQVDAGQVRLNSPPMQLRSRYNRPQLAFDYWFLNAISNNPADDSLVVSVSNGSNEVVLAIFATDSASVQAWTPSDTFDLARYINITDDMRLHITASDRSATPNVVEAGLDNFRVWEGLAEGDITTEDELVKFRIYPNPFGNEFTLDYKLLTDNTAVSVLIFNVLGQQIQKISGDIRSAGSIQIDMSGEVESTYFLAFRVNGKLSKAERLVKVK